MDEYLAIIKMFAGNFAPRGYMYCQGQTLAISTNTALFSLLGTTFGGDGQTTFALPDLRGRMPVGAGQGPGLAGIVVGERGGSASVTILSSQMPMHTHAALSTVAIPALADDGGTNEPGPTAVFASAPSATTIYSTNPPDTTLLPFAANVSVQPAGGSQPVGIMNPFLGMNYIICVEGVYPSRN